MTRSPGKYAEVVTDWLVDEGYTHCYFVAGGNIMHLLDGCRSRFTCVPVVHEVAAGIAVEYFNESGGSGRAFALVTAGPGLTNVITAMAGAWLESRELLVLGGQVKSEDLRTGDVRQRGIQEVDGTALAAPVCKAVGRIETPWTREEFLGLARLTSTDRPGPVFIEICLDAQGAPVDEEQWTVGASDQALSVSSHLRDAGVAAGSQIAELTRAAKRPIWLIGGGVTRSTAARLHDELVGLGVPLMTTWNGADRLSRLDPTYVGRPNTWGQRAANLLVDKADVVVVFGSRLGLQQTGFNWQEWASHATVVQIEIDESELRKGHPRIDLPIHADANAALEATVAALNGATHDPDWLKYCQHIRSLIPLNESSNVTGAGFVSPYSFYEKLAALSNADDIVVPCSSGGANSTAMQTFETVQGQILIVDKGLASMGYGLAGAIGASMAWPGRRVLLVEGDGGFTQNLQELATVAVNKLPIKIFIFANNGYGSIRTTQRNYFGGAYLGCDVDTGLGFPDWPTLFSAYGIDTTELDEHWDSSADVVAALAHPAAHAFIVPIDPDQTYWPKITSRITDSGSMESNPLHRMSPEPSDEVQALLNGFPE